MILEVLELLNDENEDENQERNKEVIKGVFKEKMLKTQYCFVGQKLKRETKQLSL